MTRAASILLGFGVGEGITQESVCMGQELARVYKCRAAMENMDECPIDRDMLGSLPLVAGRGWVLNDFLSIMQSSKGYGIYAYWLGDDGEIIEGFDMPKLICRLKTFGQFRRICEGLGVKW